MNELDLLLAATVEACRHRRQLVRTTLNTGRRDKINLARPIPRAGASKTQNAAA